MELIKIHPAIHILYYLILIVFAMIYKDLYYLLTFVLLIFVLFYLEDLLGKLKTLFKIFIPFALIIIILNPITNQSGATKLVSFGSFAISFEALFYGVIMCISLLLVLMILTSYNNEVTYQEMLYIFSKKMPHVSMIIVMALRYIPLITNRIKEFSKINALSIENEKFKMKLLNLQKALGGVVSWSLEESLQTAKSMRARGYGTKKRTSYLSYEINTIDYIFLITIIIFTIINIIGFIQGYGNCQIYPELKFSFKESPISIYYLSFIILLLPLIILEIRDKLYWIKRG